MRLRIREEHRAMPAYEKPPAWRVDVYCPLEYDANEVFFYALISKSVTEITAERVGCLFLLGCCSFALVFNKLNRNIKFSAYST